MPQVVIIEEKFAQRFWPKGDAIGKHLWFAIPRNRSRLWAWWGWSSNTAWKRMARSRSIFRRQQDAERHVPGGAHVIGCGGTIGRRR